ncbi:cytochrome P450 [Mycena sp. CBHHK59/15]|nr:cytochrome P450 [Mycena sp. CBHHK59/15]
MHPVLPIACLFIFIACYATYRRFTRISVAGIPGPESRSWLLGEAEFKWQEIYGGVVRIKASFGEDRLLVTDPKALQYIYQTSGYRFHKQPERIELTRLISGRGILWADGNDHKRHRKVMLPGFGTPETKALLPLFFSYAAQIGTKWKDIIGATADQSAVLDVTAYAKNKSAVLIYEIVSPAAFDYQFGAMENVDNVVGTAYSNVFMDTFGSPSNISLLALSMLQYVPRRVREFLVDHVPCESLRHIRYTAKVTTSVARELVASKSAALLRGGGSRDIMSLLVKANASENEKTRLNEDELLSQMRTIIMAGHETTANSFSWAVLELARQPKIQARLRSEIRMMERTIQARGSHEFTTTDIESMPYLSAVVKEVLRFHPVSFNNFRQSATDDVLPLLRPITLRSGEVITELPVPKGMKVIISIAAYNRNKDRWLNGSLGKPEAPVGAYANLLTFAGGLRTCIGWRFAVLELQAFLIELLGHFEFSLTPEAMRIRREACIVMVPTVEGQRDKGTQLPMRVTVVTRDYE